jgi:ubiquinone/menaquinone biosynthesis C-methylase UbiE
MVVLEPGPGMGFFTLDLARMVGTSGRVVAVDVQEKMVDRLRRRASKAGLLDRMDLRLAQSNRLGVDDLEGTVDLVVAIFVVHEMPDGDAFYTEAHRVLRSGGRLIVAEPRFHVSKDEFERSIEAAERTGFTREENAPFSGTHAALLARP